MTDALQLVHVVDDDASVRKALANVLKAEGFKVAAYASAEEFLRTRQAGEPTCVVLDLQMPGLSGLELQESLAQCGDDLPVIFLTGHGDTSARMRAINAGAVAFLSKPVEATTLLNAVRSALARSTKRTDA